MICRMYMGDWPERHTQTKPPSTERAGWGQGAWQGPAGCSVSVRRSPCCRTSPEPCDLRTHWSPMCVSLLCERETRRVPPSRCGTLQPRRGEKHLLSPRSRTEEICKVSLALKSIHQRSRRCQNGLAEENLKKISRWVMSSQQKKITGVLCLALLEQLISSRSIANAGARILLPWREQERAWPLGSRFLRSFPSLRWEGISAPCHRSRTSCLGRSIAAVKSPLALGVKGKGIQKHF